MIAKIAVLITCHNRRNKTISCLHKLFKQKGIFIDYDIEVFLTDDASTDGTGHAVKELFPYVNIVSGNGHLYWNRGMHLAWTTAIQANIHYDYYLWLNDDTDLISEAIIVMLATENHHKDKSLVCGSVRSAITGEYTYGCRFENGKKIIPNGQIQECFTINGNCVLVSKKLVYEIGILDPVYPHAISDLDYGLRALYANFKVITPAVYVGYCESNEIGPKWWYSSTPIIERFKTLYSPLGNSHPYYFFLFEKRYFGLFTSIKHYFSIHLRALLPSLWKKKMLSDFKINQ